ncbi:hypothetical protein CVT24_012369 [Panaeolus cyanescens]|uniref:peptidyl-tRNA hydrolase n=1 Tax=Panaeolus cyanescens TaxID=181874 RepID=A0A409YYM0_9AGAR|nr:hypothetical protein CVT24_012369 [Panaeolus cyanescens]
MPCHSNTQMALVALAHTALFLALGYKLGQHWTAPETKKDIPLVNGTNETEEEIDDSEDEEDIADGDLAAVKAGFLEPCKLVLVVRTDLGMTPGKIAAQLSGLCAHSPPPIDAFLVKHWERTGQAKIALKATSEDQLLELEAIAKSLNLCARSILDAGRTEVAAGSRTVLGIGPAPVSLVNEVTGKLRLL